MRTVENMKFEFSPSEMSMTESMKGDTKWLNIGGTALTECKSKNKNRYRMENLQENDGRTFKWLVGHPSNPERHVVGKGQLRHEGNKLLHEGAIRNTADYPDIVEKVKDGFYGPSIHASASKVTYDEDSDEYKMEGLSIDGVGLVAFQGVEQASIDYAIAESFGKYWTAVKEDKEDEKETNKDNGENTMTDEPEKPTEPEAPKEDTVPVARLEAVQKELDELRESKKQELVSKIVEMNSELDKDKLMEEDESVLQMRLQYESKLVEKEPQESAIVTEDEEEEDAEKEEVVEEKDGSVSMTKEAYDSFNRELVERIR
jgi:hypothetical protein